MELIISLIRGCCLILIFFSGGHLILGMQISSEPVEKLKHSPDKIISDVFRTSVWHEDEALSI